MHFMSTNVGKVTSSQFPLFHNLFTIFKRIISLFVATRLWYVGLTCMLRGIRKQISLVDRSMLWLKELYIQLFTEGGGCEPLASDAIRVSI